MNFLRQYWILILLALPFFVALDDSSVWDSTEAYYAQTPREMVERGDWVVPYFNGQPRLNKPPLAYWVVAPFYKFFGVSLFWERLVLAILAYGCVLAVFVNGRILFDHRIALLAAGIFATTFRIMILSRRLLVDTLLLFCLLWAIAYFFWWMKSQRRIHFITSSVFLGLAFLSKGPVAFLPIIFLGSYLLLSGRFKQLAKAPLVIGGGIYITLCSFWFLLLGFEVGWQPIINFFIEENVNRFVSIELGPRRPYYYYLGVFVGDFFPWSLFFMAAVIESFRDEKFRPKHAMLLGLWFATYFLFFSLSYNKQEYYITPLYPAAALWVAYYFCRRLPPRLLVAVIGVIFLILGGVFWVILEVLFDEALLWIPLLFLPIVIVGLLRGHYALAVSAFILFYAGSFSLYLKPWEAFKPVPHFAQTINRITSKATEKADQIEVGYYKLAAPSLTFYLDRQIVELSDLETALALLKSNNTVYLIVSSEGYQELNATKGLVLRIVETRPKLYTTARTLIEGFRRGRSNTFQENWVRPVYLITNDRDG